MRSLFAVTVAVVTAVKYYTGGRSSVRRAARQTTTGQRTTVTEPIRGLPMNPSPFEAALQNGRLHEREDVLKYLSTFAATTNIEELWEAVDYIKMAKHNPPKIDR